MLAVNVAVPIVASWALRLVPGGAGLVPVLMIAAGLLALNLWVARRYPERRGWVWGVIALNLAALAGLGSIAAATAVPGLWLLLRMAF